MDHSKHTCDSSQFGRCYQCCPLLAKGSQGRLLHTSLPYASGTRKIFVDLDGLGYKRVVSNNYTEELGKKRALWAQTRKKCLQILILSSGKPYICKQTLITYMHVSFWKRTQHLAQLPDCSKKGLERGPIRISQRNKKSWLCKGESRLYNGPYKLQNPIQDIIRIKGPECNGH